MRRTASTLLGFALVTSIAGTALAANPVRISQVYGGGGGSTAGATYAQDYVELFNFSNSAVNIGGWTVEYGSATGNWGSSSGNIFTFPAGATIGPCSYLLINLGTVGTGGPPNPVAADYSNTTTNLSATTGKVALFNAVNSNLACGSEIAGTLVDKVSYGTGNCPETANVGSLSISTGAVRNAAGMTDTDNNSSDFTIVANPVPHNSASGPNPDCLVVPARRSSWGSVKTLYR